MRPVQRLQLRCSPLSGPSVTCLGRGGRLRGWLDTLTSFDSWTLFLVNTKLLFYRRFRTALCTARTTMRCSACRSDWQCSRTPTGSLRRRFRKLRPSSSKAMLVLSRTPEPEVFILPTIQPDSCEIRASIAGQSPAQPRAAAISYAVCLTAVGCGGTCSVTVTAGAGVASGCSDAIGSGSEATIFPAKLLLPRPEWSQPSRRRGSRPGGRLPGAGCIARRSSGVDP